MDAVEITRLLDEAHPDGVTWETHLAFVEQMAEWEVERILDFQESLFAYLLEGSWVLSWSGAVTVLPSGHRVSASNFDNHLSMIRGVVSMLQRSPESPGLASAIAQQTRELEAMEVAERPEVVRVPVASNLVGIPALDAFAETWTKSMIRGTGKPSRRRLMNVVNDESLTNARDLVRVMRSAAWAHEIKTGTRLKGVLPSSEEELHRSGGMRLCRAVQMVERDGERIEVVDIWPAPNLAYYSARLGSIAPFTRALSARVNGMPRFTDLGPLDGLAVPDGAVIDEWRTHSESSNALLRDARALMSGESRRRTTQPLSDDRFWALIDVLDGTAANADVLTAALRELPLADIVAFTEALADALHALDRPELTSDPDDPEQLPMSEDVFLYFRCSVVAAGRGAFERVLHEDVLRERDWDDEGAGERLLGVGPAAFEAKTGRDWDHETHVSFETGSNREAWGSQRSLQSRGWAGWMRVRSRAKTPEGEVDTVRHWRIEDPAQARAKHLEVENLRPGWTEVRVIDDLRISSSLPGGILGAPVDWVRVPIEGRPDDGESSSGMTPAGAGRA